MLALRVLHTKAKTMLRKIAETLIFPAFFSSFFSDYVVLF